MTDTPARQRVVIIGGGFGGLYTAKALGSTQFEVTLIDKRNFHLFQPLLYQVATGTLSPADISSPLRAIVSKHKNVRVLMDEAIDIDPVAQKVILKSQEIEYDKLIVATGASHHYFGNDQWKDVAPGLKTIEDAIEMRRRIFSAFEAAEKETDPALRRAWLTFVIVGAGPAGVELAGAIADLAFKTMKDDFHHIDPTETQVILLEGLDRVLPPYPPELSQKAQIALERLGVKVQVSTRVTNIEEGAVTVLQGEASKTIPAKTVLWAAGVKASPIGKVLEERAGATLDRVGRVMVQPDLSLASQPNIYVIGDLANFSHQGDKPLPGVAAVAMQEGEYVSDLLQAQAKGATLPAFTYTDLGSMAVIGDNEAVVDMGFIKFSGFFAWLAWVVVHIYYLIEVDNKIVVMTQWAWNYFTRSRGARIITGTDLQAVSDSVDSSVDSAEEKVPALSGK
ncbi:NAD(P)/FAD-dependent oxidoreductase [Alkalinema pantanalense CENA528]|uniref:NAD(P)/FAD-dependent oxidoreductase n=1 Tax=Alkalinema pantanalense TaxID=1620705 RepID=UPI003D6E9105